MQTLESKLPTFVPDEHYSLEEWQAIEQATGECYEYHDGKLVSVRAMAGGSWRHALLSYNSSGIAFRELSSPQNRRRGCNGYSSDLRLAITPRRRYVYPDVAIVCGPPRFDTFVPSAVTNPIIVFEVLSPSTSGYDAGEIFDHYAALASLRSYVLVSQDRRRVEVRSRTNEDATWETVVYGDQHEAFILPAIDATFEMADLYRGWDTEEEVPVAESEKL